MTINKQQGVVFHYFHDLHKYRKCQGSLNIEEFIEVLDYLENRYTVLTPDEWFFKHKRGTIGENEIILTFDGGLKSQYDIAYKTLKKRGLLAAFFIYTAPLTGTYPIVELCHDFRFLMYENVNEFYKEFFAELFDRKLVKDIENVKEKVIANGYLGWGDFYTLRDRMFKYIRDHMLTDDQYSEIIYTMMDKMGYNSEDRRSELWIGAEDIKKLSSDGNAIGSHSHSHPSNLIKLTINEQREEYCISKRILEEILGAEVNIMSHPANSYNEKTLEILAECGYSTGFCNGEAEIRSKYLVPRTDHANIIRSMNYAGKQQAE